MKVQDTNLTGTSALPASGGVTRQASVDAGASAKSAYGDRVELSGFAGKLGATLAAQSQDQSARVAALERSYQSGGYSVDAGATSRALVDETLAAGSQPEAQ
jgi:anti-sigma28 factor (negative regulator of flagellin synthesis)